MIAFRRKEGKGIRMDEEECHKSNDEIRRGKRSSMNVTLSPSIRSSSRFYTGIVPLKLDLCNAFFCGKGHRVVCVCVCGVGKCRIKYVLLVCYSRFGQTPPLISGSVDLEGHCGFICPGVDCLSNCRIGLESTTIQPRFLSAKKGSCLERNSWEENGSEKDRERIGEIPKKVS